MDILELLQDGAVAALGVFLSLILPSLIGAAVGWLLRKSREPIDWAKSKYPNAWRILMKGVTEAVKEAERLGEIDELEDKLQYAITYVQDWMYSHGLGHIDVGHIVDLIESEVLRLYNAEKLLDVE